MNKSQIECIIENDFYQFQTKFRRKLKDLIKDPTKKVIFSVRRNFQASPLRQIEYVMEIVPANQVHLYNIEEMAQKGYAIPATPDFPEVEKETDPTKNENESKIEASD